MPADSHGLHLSAHGRDQMACQKVSEVADAKCGVSVMRRRGGWSGRWAFNAHLGKLKRATGMVALSAKVLTVMRMRGLEPPRNCFHSVLSAARLPVPPHPHEASD